MSGNPFLLDPFAATLTEYPKKIPLPGVEPTFEPISVSIACQWIPYVTGAMKALLQEAAWDTDDPTALSQVLGQVQNLIDIIATADQGCAANGVPFACPGDATISTTPYGTWTITFAGSYVPGSGYQTTDVTYGSNFIRGIGIGISLSSPVAITGITIGYDLLPGPHIGLPSSTIVEHIVDVTNSVVVDTATFDTLSAGAGQSRHKSMSGALCDHLDIELDADYNSVSLALLGGTATITSIAIQGITPTGATAPC